MRTKRSKNITEERLAKIIDILDGWTGRLTWELLIDAIALRLGSRYTRQALHKHESITVAFGVRRKSTPSAAPREGSIQLQKSLERLARVEAENERLRVQNDRLLEQFARWAFNAYVRGVSEDELNRPLPEIDRRPTPVLVHSKPLTRVITSDPA